MLPVVVGVHLHVARADVHLVAVVVHAVIVGVLVVVLTVPVLDAAVVRRGKPIEAILERLLALLVPLEVPNDFVLLVQHLAPTERVVAVEVLMQVLELALFTVAVVAGSVPLDETVVVCGKKGEKEKLLYYFW